MADIDFIRDRLQEAASLVATRYAERDQVHVTSKTEANDLLTEVDLAVQKLLVDRIRQSYPNDVIVGEEDGYNQFPEDPSVRAWVLDPIDGTQNFVRGLFPTFGVSVALAEGGLPIAGGVALPLVQQVYLAQRGAGAYRNGARVHVSDLDSLGLARIEIDFATQPDREETLERFARIIVEGGQVRCHCAAVVPLVSIAAGEMDVYLHVSLNPWDYAAGQLLVEEAGGRTSRLDGRPLRLFEKARGVLATNGRVHDAVLQTLRETHPSASPGTRQ